MLTLLNHPLPVYGLLWGLQLHTTNSHYCRCSRWPKVVKSLWNMFSGDAVRLAILLLLMSHDCPLTCILYDHDHIPFYWRLYMQQNLSQRLAVQISDSVWKGCRVADGSLSKQEGWELHRKLMKRQYFGQEPPIFSELLWVSWSRRERVWLLKIAIFVLAGSFYWAHSVSTTCSCLGRVIVDTRKASGKAIMSMCFLCSVPSACTRSSKGQPWISEMNKKS